MIYLGRTGVAVAVLAPVAVHDTRSDIGNGAICFFVQSYPGCTIARRGADHENRNDGYTAGLFYNGRHKPFVAELKPKLLENSSTRAYMFIYKQGAADMDAEAYAALLEVEGRA